MAELKHQTPNTKPQSNSKLQARSRARRFGVWCLVSFSCLVFGVWCLRSAPRGPQSAIISAGPGGALVYDADERGNRVPDFSYCGYAGCERPIPRAPVRVVVPPGGGDATARIQKAIDYVAGLPLDTNGLRGAVLLLRGRHELLGGLLLQATGMVLRGQGMGKDGTVLVAAGLDRRTLIRIAGQPGRVRTGAAREIADEYVPVGAMSFRLQDTSGLKAGETISIVRPSAKEWIEQLGMNDFGGGIGWPAWAPGSRDLEWERTIVAIEGDRVRVDAPLTTALETRFGGGRVEACSWPGRVRNVGIENLRCESVFDARNPKDENHAWMAITMENAENAWVRQVTAAHFAGSLVALWESCKRVTVQDCLSLAPVSEEGGYRRDTFFTMGQLTLFLRCWAEHGWHDFAAGHCAAGPNAFVQCEASQPLRESGPIESWASGVLYDNVKVDGQALRLGNRGRAAQGAGWAAANSVLWQCSASVIGCANPPTARNWAFGCWGEFEGDGLWRNSNQFVKPESLFTAQLTTRLGLEADPLFQLMRRLTAESSNPTLEQAAQVVAASGRPAPQLRDYIAAASTRDPILCEPADAKRVEELDKPSADTHAPRSTLHAPRSPLLLTNGWLTCDGRLLTGGSAEVAWWRGNIRPSEAPNSGVGVTRFVPGRLGPGFTDDLTELAGLMETNGQAALDYHYGLWYERRRDDHERVRRIDGDVWPPFYEMPFARTGQGTAWNGLSRYDLTRFNPWYWGRLKEFADLCDRRGLVLFHQNYFQHHILEAGAHWADSPWRPANNINDTGFPEPPPYAGDKRIFMAEQFYDVTHSVRRGLHRAYIRQCLENFAGNSNVIQFTSAEYTGPLAFVQFWLDTIGDWVKETGHKPLVALSCTKDVQDAVLIDAERSSRIDVVDFRYWWLTSKGLFAPKGGQNLAPRQFERQWKGGRPTDTNLAEMAAEYRRLYPGKALLCDFNQAGWAWLCAGGSLPRLPKTTDARLLAAIPRMRPWQADASKKSWALSEPGKACLIYSGNGSEAIVDLSQEQGSFEARLVSEDGRVAATGEKLQAGRVATIRKPAAGRTVFWLTRD